MPNWVTNRVLITGEKQALARFEQQVLIADSEMDFERIIPMPEILKNSIKGSVSYEVDAVLRGDTEKLVRRGFPAAYLSDFASTMRWVRIHRPELYEQIGIQSRARAQTGYSDWYGWSLDQWGTKWNSGVASVERVNDTEMILFFDTAWSVPEPVLSEIVHQYPELHLSVRSFDEGWCFAYTAEIFADGEARVWCDSACIEATDEVFREVYGFDPEVFDDDVEESA